MNANTYDGLNPLDKIRLSQGKEKLKTYFKNLGENQRDKAVKYINDKRLIFTSLFLLLPEIESLNLYEQLNTRNILALKMCAKTLGDQKIVSDVELFFEETHETLYPVLKWMLITGSKDDGLSNQFDEIMDVTALLLTRTYLDKTILPVIEQMIFKRYEKGLYIHDLVWALFQIHDKAVLKLVAKHLLSSEARQVELACRLLNLPYSKANGRNTSRNGQYVSYRSWLKENDGHLYFTGESFQMTSYPKPCDIELTAKYLCKEISPHDRKPVVPFTEKENYLIEQFNGLAQEDKNMLSAFSHKMQNKNSQKWNKWLERPLGEQIKNAKSGRGGIR
jgi:hypothetical protein